MGHNDYLPLKRSNGIVRLMFKQTYITRDIKLVSRRKVALVTFLGGRVPNKNIFEYLRIEFAAVSVLFMNKGSTSKHFRRQ